MDDASIVKEEKVKLGENISLSTMKILIDKAQKSVCEIVKKN